MVQARKKDLKESLASAPNSTTTITSKLSNFQQGSYGSATSFAKYYNFPPPSSSPSGGPTIAVVSMDGFYNLSDLQTYWTQYCGLTRYPTVIPVAVGAGHTLPKYTGSDSDVENTLDLEILGANCPNATLIFVSVGNSDIDFMTAFSTCISGIKIVDTNASTTITYRPTIISCSWGSTEVASDLPIITEMNQVFANGVANGVTIVCAAGDDGCQDGDTTDNLPHVDFPASSPWVISVGGTSVSSQGTETFWSWLSSRKWGGGGGYSTIFQAPPWQNGLATLPINTTPNVSYLQGMRSVPDVALPGDPLHGYVIYMGGQELNNIGGTSCGAPMMSAFFGLINLNFPLGAAAALYSVYRNPNQKIVFRDVTTGSNDGIPKSTGIWDCKVGFNPCVGMGSFNGLLLSSALQVSSNYSHSVISAVPSGPIIQILQKKKKSKLKYYQLKQYLNQQYQGHHLHLYHQRHSFPLT